MKPVFTFFAFSLLFFFSCKKEEKFMSDAIITGSDARMCACCGGFMITFDGETQPYKGDFKLINNGEEVGISEKDKFPVYVKVDWRVVSKCGVDRIEITKLKRK